MLFVFAVFATRAAAPQFDQAGLNTAEQAASERLLGTALQRLPPGWRDGLEANLQLRWRDDLPEDVHGHAQNGKISLQRELLRQWMRQPDVEAPALRALLHELAHVYDRSVQGGLSRDPRLLDLAGWQLRPLRFGLRGSRNPFTDRSPDRYELKNPREFVAVNLEWFLLDPQYACRRPALHRYLSAHFGWEPASADCAPGQVFLRADAAVGEAGIEQIDPAQVYAVDYLLAEPDGQTTSRWGHSMLRLVICAPERAPGPDCRLDLQYHRVLSFRAFVGDVQISSWRGLTGRYPSRLFLLPLDQVIDEYTKVELRSLRSVPLKLSSEEIASLLERAAQLHWSYDGRYYFIDNNCAVETWRLLREGVPRLAALPLRSVTPTGLLRRLQRSGIADASVQDAHEQALQQGYYFASAREHYQQMLAVAARIPNFPAHSLSDWLKRSPDARAAWLKRGSLPETAALLVLEEAALRRAELQARNTIKHRLLHAESAQTARAELQQVLAREGLLLRPASLGGSGYGLPQQERAVLSNSARQLAQALGSDWRRLRQAARASLTLREQQTLHGCEDNLAVLGARLRALNRATGGLELH